MPTGKKVSALLTLRIDSRMARHLAREARRRRTSRSELARSILEAGLRNESGEDRLAAEARRQSLLVSHLRSEKKTLDFIQAAADMWDWR
jgi:hypothetical protein